MEHCRFLWNFLGVSHESLREFRTNLKRVSHESLREFRTNLGFSCDDCISWLKKACHCRGDAMWGLGGLPHFWGVAVVAAFRSHFHSKHVMVSCARECFITASRAKSHNWRRLGRRRSCSSEACGGKYSPTTRPSAHERRAKSPNCAASVSEVAAQRPPAHRDHLQRGHQRMRERPKATTTASVSEVAAQRLRVLLRTVITHDAANSA